MDNKIIKLQNKIIELCNNEQILNIKNLENLKIIKRYIKNEINIDELEKLSKEEILFIVSVFKQRNDESYEKLLLKSIEKGNLINYIDLGDYYDKIHKYKLAEKYYLLAIENNIIEAYIKMAKYNECCIATWEKYLLQGYGYGCGECSYELGFYNELVIEDYELAEEYYKKSIEYGNEKALERIINIYEKQERFEELKEYTKELILNEKIDIINFNHFQLRCIKEEYIKMFKQLNSIKH